ncbi:MAG: TonB-dependent receptor [Verrucomicrobia bacterium]|nr:TonB-dependent receptor [Verrucomicrobiota bacterium]
MKLLLLFLLYISALSTSFTFAETGSDQTTAEVTGKPTQADQSQAPTQPSPPSPVNNSSSTELNRVVVVGQLDQARDQIVPYLGATKYSIGQQQIQTQSQGANAPFNQVILRAPGVAQDSYGQLHIRDEHANLQFRINDVLIPEGITGFGQEIDTHLVKSVDLITGSLPAQFGFRTSGIIDIHTKDGVALNGGDASYYGGSHETIFPSFQVGGAQARLNYFVLGSYNQNNLGIENPTGGYHAIHDYTEQYKGFANVSYIIDDSSRMSLLLSGTYSDFQIPANPGQTPLFALAGAGPKNFDSRFLSENQHEQNEFGILAYQKSFENVSLQVAAFTRYSATLFTPDDEGDLIFTGLAGRIDRSILSNGIQTDASWAINDSNVLRGGFLLTVESARVETNNQVFPVDASGAQTSAVPFTIVDNHRKTGAYYGLYLQDEWKIFEPLTINFGARFDVVDEYAHANQLSPRVNVVYQATKSTTLHAGYARYFTPPPLELVQSESISKFAGTSNQSAVPQSSSVQPERAHYFDAGMTEQFTSSFSMSVDGYYKISRNLIDEGQFGSALIFSPFNYAKGNQYGVEVTASCTHGGFNAYANFGFERGTGTQINSGQFLFGPDELAFIRNHWVFLDHDQRYTLSAGASYTCKDTTVYADILYGSGLRSGFANTDELPGYYPVNLGFTYAFHLPEKYGRIQVRFDVTNLFDQSYELRNGTGIGVFAPQFGPRRGFFGGIRWIF